MNPALEAAQARARMHSALRAFFESQGFLEVETPILVAAPGMEPHIDPFRVTFIPTMSGGPPRPAWLHTSPEYAMKRLLALPDCPALFQICKVFRNGEVASAHNPEFSMLEFYRPNADYRDIMNDTEAAFAAVERAVAPERNLFSRTPYERRTVQEVFLEATGVDPLLPEEDFLRAARGLGLQLRENPTFEDVFFQAFLERVEPHLGIERPCFLYDYPASMASLARLAPNRRVAERVELYACGVELGNGFSELTDEAEQRARLVAEQSQRRAAGREVLPIDEDFLAAVGKMPPCAGIALGLDRLLMLLLQCRTVGDVLLFPWS